MKIAYILYKVQEKYLHGVANDEDKELLDFLKTKGLDIYPEIWNDEKVNWEQYSVALLKSPWDYFENIQHFYVWLSNLDKMGIRLLNPTSLVKWNSDKHYLKDIEQKGLNVIPSLFLEKGSVFENNTLFFNSLKSEKIVLKPCVSAGAKNTLVLTQNNLASEINKINLLLKEESYLIQPYEKEILKGEWSFLFFNQKYSHSILKTPKQGDFRVQHYLGGSIHYQQAKELYVNMANEYIQAFAKNSLYARVDGIIKDEQFHLMELELIEPYLFLNYHPKTFENYYQALVELL